MHALGFNDFLNESREAVLYTCIVHLDMYDLDESEVKEVFSSNDVDVVDIKSGAVSDSESWKLRGEKNDIEDALSEIGYDSDEVEFKRVSRK